MTEHRTVRRGFVVALVLALTVASCGGGSTPPDGSGDAAPASLPESLRSVEVWELSRLSSLDTLPEGERPTLRVMEDRRVSGSTGCNQMSGGFDAGPDSLSFTQMVTTRKACLEEVMRLETAYLDALAGTRNARVEDGILSLLDANGAVVAQFVPGSGG